MQGGILLYAMNTGDSQWKEQFRKHLEYWTTGYGGKQIAHTPDGLAWLFQWGSMRHATTTAFLAYVAADELFADDTAAATKYTDFADSTMNYAFGDNDLDMSYVIGMGDKSTGMAPQNIFRCMERQVEQHRTDGRRRCKAACTHPVRCIGGRPRPDW